MSCPRNICLPQLVGPIRPVSSSATIRAPKEPQPYPHGRQSYSCRSCEWGWSHSEPRIPERWHLWVYSKVQTRCYCRPKPLNDSNASSHRALAQPLRLHEARRPHPASPHIRASRPARVRLGIQAWHRHSDRPQCRRLSQEIPDTATNVVVLDSRNGCLEYARKLCRFILAGLVQLT